jgi:hypothetical protein
MPSHKIGTREEWQAARDELSKLEAEHTSFLLERTPKDPPEEPRAWRKDEYPD